MLPNKPLSSRRFVALSVLLMLACGGVAHPVYAQSAPQVSEVATAVPDVPAKRERGGVVYDPALPLNAIVTPPKPTASDTKPTSITYTIQFDSANGQKVPGFFVTPVGAKAAPTVLLLHGLGGSKSDMMPLAWGLAQKGFASLTIDAAGHGARPRIDGKQAINLGLTSLHGMVAQTVADLGHAVDFLATRPEVDPKRIGYLGISMGAIEGTVFVADEPRIKDAVFWAGGGDWGKLLTTTSLREINARKQGAKDAASDLTLTPEAIEKVMTDVDPVNRVSAIAPRPVLFINGDKDTVVPVPCTNELIAAAGEPKTRITLPGGHIPDPLTMALKSLDFFSKNLK